MESANKKMSAAMNAAFAEYMHEVLVALSARYNFPVAEAAAWLQVEQPVCLNPVPVPAAVPVVAKAPKKKVNKAAVVEDVIARLMNTPAAEAEAAAAPKKKSRSKKAAVEEPAVTTAEVTAKVAEVTTEAPQKKSRSKKAAAAAPAEAAAVVPAVATTEVTAAAPKKRSSSKKAAAVVVPAVVVPAEAAPAVAEAVAAPKKKSSSKKAAAPAAVAVPEVAGGDAPKKKSSSKKAAVTEVAPVAAAVIELETPAVTGEELTDEEYLAEHAEDLLQSEEEEFEYKGITYLKCKDNIVFSAETNEEIGRWNGKSIEFFANDE